MPNVGRLQATEFQDTKSIFINEGKANDWFILHVSYKVSHVKFLPYLLELKMFFFFFASVDGHGSSC